MFLTNNAWSLQIIWKSITLEISSLRTENHTKWGIRANSYVAKSLCLYFIICCPALRYYEYMSFRCDYMPTLSFNTMWIKVFHHYHNYVCDAIYSPVFHMGVPDFNYTELKWLHFFSTTWENKRVCIIRHHTTLSPLWWLSNSTICEESMPVGTCSFWCSCSLFNLEFAWDMHLVAIFSCHR